jgi:hypothetical protein
MDSRLLGDLMNMQQRELVRGDGLPVRVFDGDETHGICFVYRSERLGDVKVIALIDDSDVQTEFIACSDDAVNMLKDRETVLRGVLDGDDLNLAEMTVTIDRYDETNGGKPGTRVPIGIDFRV